ncbi:MAG: DEAD/DEAH box helicase [bacterium]|nr:DEAD/DEAH box helicase [bacterium]
MDVGSNEQGFKGLGIAPGVLTILDKLGYKMPTPIQKQSIPVAIEGKDLMGIAQTGTGKTLAFGVPLIQLMLKGGSLGLVIAPTRELAIQIQGVLEKIGVPLGIKTACLIGGEPIYKQLQRLSRNPHIIIATPGRLLDHMTQRSVSLSKVRALVWDEADRMLDMGFEVQLRKILAALPTVRQTMLFSATMPEEIVKIANTYLKLPIRVEIARSGTTAKDVTQEVFFVAKEDKLRLLEKVLSEYRGSALVFCRMKFGAKKVAAAVRAFGHTAAEIHANRSLNQRKEALDGFKMGKYRILVATDIAARGIDVSNIEVVINYDLPSTAEDYVHRIGRTGRIGRSGHAISFAMPDQRNDVRGIERLIKSVLPVSPLPVLPPHRAKIKLAQTDMDYSRPAHTPASRQRTGNYQKRHSNSVWHKTPRRQ